MITLVFGCLGSTRAISHRVRTRLAKTFRHGSLSSGRFKDPLVRQGALEEELGGSDRKRGPIRAESGAKLLAAVPPRGERSGPR